ncbi:hypothetical protein [Flammeovirga kamogawensis]|uniref:Uncharacterized protein n=1 Tax=Flammeovirga kamogawensis TaxID=373891 RepID=A0ABX8GT58_9BACT|nr:hypothetical protein [Flammeovirga kamogawensis]MBB6462488.1 hypothetical protein [Flammeovirga kamogawensis]QWG06775.1 hypothetical protein KM029_15910 [Flammeovirga kamogawensis]TRX68598.1 hypothetical protein EO216_10905 [Flammeovirga kamogawensis]
MQAIKEEEKQIVGKSFISEKLGAHLMGGKLDALSETRLIHLSRDGWELSKLKSAYGKQQQLIEKYKEAFIIDEKPSLEDDVPPMLAGLLNPLLLDIFSYEEELGNYILNKITSK